MLLPGLRELKTRRWLKAAKKAVAAERWHEAASVAEQVLAAKPAHREALMIAGVANAQAGEWAKAKDYCVRAVALAPNRVLLWKNLATASVHVGDWAAAESAYEQLVTLCPEEKNYAKVLEQVRAKMGGRRGDRGAATAGTLTPTAAQKLFLNAEYEKLAQSVTDGDAPESVRILQGIALLRLNRPQKAIDVFERILEKNPDSLVSRQKLALAHAKSGHWQRAEEIFRSLKATVLEHRDEPKMRKSIREVLFNLAICHEMQGQLAMARAEYEELLKHEPDCAQARQRLEQLDMPLAVRHFVPDLLGVKWRPEDMSEDEDRCAACGATLPRGAHFCPHCGEVYGASKACCECGAKIPTDASFCGKCGAQQLVASGICPLCGLMEDEEVERCPECGGRIVYPSSGNESERDLLRKAIQEWRAGRLSDAARSLEKLSSNGGASAAVYLLLSVAEQQAGRNSEALLAAERSVDVADGMWKATACTRLGLLLALERNASQEAIVWFQNAVESDPSNGQFRCLLAWCLARCKRWKDALRECRAMSSNGHAGLASFLHAQVLEQQGDTSRAAVLLVRAFYKEMHAA